MSITGRDIFETALALMGERSDAVNIDDYIDRAVPLLNLIFVEVYNFLMPAPQTSQDEEIFAQDVVVMPSPETVKISSLDDTVALDDRLTRNIIPYALAARLLLEEDPERAAFFDSEYEKLFKTVKNFKGKIVPIKRVCY